VARAGTELEIGNLLAACSCSCSVGGGRRPPERNEGQRERSSGRELPAGDRDMCERMAAACVKNVNSVRDRIACKKMNLEKLNLLVLAQYELGRLAPMRGVLPSMLNQARRMPIHLRNTKSRSTFRTEEATIDLYFRAALACECHPPLLTALAPATIRGDGADTDHAGWKAVTLVQGSGLGGLHGGGRHGWAAAGVGRNGDGVRSGGTNTGSERDGPLRQPSWGRRRADGQRRWRECNGGCL
jgi:hypothetical protein